MNNKGSLVNNLLAFVVILFVFAIISLFAHEAWSLTNDTFQNMSNDTVRPDVKADIDDLSKYMTYNDTFFVLLFVALIISYLIIASFSPTEKPYFLLIFMGSLILITLITMTFSNMWAFTLTAHDWTVLDNYKFTDWVMSFMPVITFFVGVAGAVLFYIRKANFRSSGGGDQFS